MDEPFDLLGLSPSAFARFLIDWGEPAYRVAQIQRWIYNGLAGDFEAMTDLPRSLRERLKSSARIGTLVPLGEQTSADGLTRKVLFELHDGQTLETVLMQYADEPDPAKDADAREVYSESIRRTVCVSTQVGCPIGCPFCATGQAGFVRNLSCAEIIAQVLYFARDAKAMGYEQMPVTHVVIMGMGEPLNNFDATWQAVETLTDPSRFGLGARRITISTSGLIPGMQRLINLRSQVNLAVSLHAADDELRNRLVPINRRYPLPALMEKCREYVAKTHRRITFEYALMEGVNDQLDQARAVARLVRGLLCHINLIPLNPTAYTTYRRPSYDQVRAFERVLRKAGIPTTLRVEKGIEIAAGCGQLRQKAATLKPVFRTASPAVA